MKLVIDPGHTGMSDPGAVAAGVREADLTLDIGLRLQVLLKSARGLDVRMTRNLNTDLARPYTQANDLKARTDLANSWPADLFLSLHINAAATTSAHGYETWIYQSAAAETRRVARIVHERIVRRFRADRGVKETSSLYVLKNTRMPAVLVELGFISNDADRVQLQQPSFRQLLAESLRDALHAAYPSLALPPPTPPDDPADTTERIRALEQQLAQATARAAAAEAEVSRLRNGMQVLLA